jgi:hypothetical protein
MTARKDSAEHPNQTIDMTKVGKSIRRLHDEVCGQKRRVEITRAGSSDVCVMICKKELESLERALQIFANTEEFAAMCENLKRIVELAERGEDGMVVSTGVLAGINAISAHHA